MRKSMLNVVERMKAFCSYKGATQKELAVIWDISGSAVSQMFGGTTSKIDVGLVLLLKEKWQDLNLTWLLLGQGEMLMKDISMENKQEHLQREIDYLTKELDRVWGLIERLDFTSEKPKKKD